MLLRKESWVYMVRNGQNKLEEKIKELAKKTVPWNANIIEEKTDIKNNIMTIFKWREWFIVTSHKNQNNQANTINLFHQSKKIRLFKNFKQCIKSESESNQNY